MSKRAKFSIPQLMAEVETLPVDLTAWLNSEIFKNRHYMFYKKVGRGQYLGYCSCGAVDIPLDKPKSGYQYTCPHCGKSVRLKNDCYKHESVEKGYIAFVQRTNHGYMSRLMFVSLITVYDNGRTREHYDIYEKQRDLLEWDGNLRQYHAAERWGGRWETVWIRGRAPRAFGYNNCFIEERPLRVFPNNLKALFSESRLYKYSQIDVAAQHFWFNPINYLITYSKYPQLEMLIKAKLYRLAHEYFLACDGWYRYEEKIKRSSKNFKELTGLSDKSDIAYCIKHDLGIDEINAYKQLKAQGARIMSPLIYFTATVNNCNHYGFKQNNTLSMAALYRYYLSQKKLNLKIQIQEFVSDYGDYLRWSTELGRDLSDTKNRKPKDFTYAHDMTLREYEETAEIRRKKAEQRAERERKQVLKKLAPHYKELLEFSFKGLCVVVPTSPEDITREGKLQGHCVGTYINRVVQGASVIVFLRRVESPNEPYYTIELNPIKKFELVQCRGKSNCGYMGEPQVKSFLDRWQKVYAERLHNLEKVKSA